MTKIIAIVGPTGSGKSALADKLAVQHNAEIISADSMQVYRGFDIGTGKVLPPDQSVPYHMLDVVPPNREYSAALFQQAARPILADIAARGKNIVVCGGTGLYVRALLDEFDLGEAASPQDSAIRAMLNRQAATMSAQEFWQRLQAHNPASAAAVDPSNKRRVIRALEIELAGKSYAKVKSDFSEYTSHYQPPQWQVEYKAIALDREELYDRINARVDEMMEMGWLDEVDGLMEDYPKWSKTASQAIGYKQLRAFLNKSRGDCDESKLSLTDTVEKIKQYTRNYAKRQLTWFRRDPRIEWIDYM